MEFAELWERSVEFRSLFLSREIRRPEEAEALWAERCPLIDWAICPEPGCQTLVPGGAHCVRHVVEGDVLPAWRWANNELFKLVKQSFGHAREFAENQYVRYSRWLVERYSGALPAGFDVCSDHPNPFVLSEWNLHPLSHISRHLVQDDVLKLSQGLQLDQYMQGFINTSGRHHHAVTIVRINDIARAIGLRPASVRAAHSRGELCMSDPASVLRYVMRKADRPRKTRSPMRRKNETGQGAGEDRHRGGRGSGSTDPRGLRSV